MVRSPVLRGALIAIEGVDRVGKTTLAQQLVNSLKNSGHSAEYIRFPDRSTPIGSLISSYLAKESHLDDHVIHLLFSANRWEWHEKIKKALLSGTTLIVDRYAYSGVAYSNAKENLTIDWCKNSDAGLVKADAVFYLTLEEMTSLGSRHGFGDEIYESHSFQSKVKKAYEQLREDSWVTFKTDGLSIEQIHEKMLTEAKKVIETNAGANISSLW